MAKMVKCKTCGADIAKNAKVCPNCGAKNKKPPVALIVIVAIFAIGIIGAAAGGGSETSTGSSAAQQRTTSSKPTKMPEPTKDPAVIREEYIASCETIAYSDIARDPDNYKGTPVTFSGKVIQVSEGWLNTVVYRIATKNGYDDIIYVTYTREEGESRILENDSITIYGNCDGVETYMSVLGGNITIPSVKMKYFETN